MERKVLLATTFIPLLAAAQPTYNAADGATTVGDVAHAFACDWADAGPGGADHTWDFSMLQIGASADNEVLAPGATPYGSSFPGANRASLSGGSYNYWNESGTQTQNVGVYQGGYALPYSDPEKIAQYPITSTSNWTDPFQGTTAVIDGAYTVRNGTYSAQVDGYGTLILPGGTYTGTLRMHYHESYHDVGHSSAGDITVYYVTDNYAWLKPGYDQALLALLRISAGYVIGEDTIPFSDATFGQLAGAVVGIDETGQNAFNMMVYPDPASAFAYVGFETSDPARTTIDLIDLSGAVVRPSWSGFAPQGPQVHRVDLTGLAPGLYAMRVSQDGKGTVTKRLIVE